MVYNSYCLMCKYSEWHLVFQHPDAQFASFNIRRIGQSVSRSDVLDDRLLHRLIFTHKYILNIYLWVTFSFDVDRVNKITDRLTDRPEGLPHSRTFRGLDARISMFYAKRFGIRISAPTEGQESPIKALPSGGQWLLLRA